MPAQALECIATFSLDTYTVTPVAGTGGTIDPATAQTINHGDTPTFTVTPEASYSIDQVSGCGGTLIGDTFTTGAIIGDCQVSASFNQDAQATTTVITGHSPNPAMVGEAVTITYQVTADTPEPASQVTVQSSGGESCTGTIADGQCTLAFANDGTFSLTASYAGDTNNQPSVSDPVQHTVDPTADLTLSLSNGQSQSVVGQLITYTLTVANPGPSDVIGGQLSAAAPSGLLWSWSCVASKGAVCTTQGVGELYDTISLPAGGQVSYTLTVTLPESYLDATLVATAEVSLLADVVDVNLANNNATDSDRVIHEANSCYGSDVLITHTTYVDEKFQGTIVCAADASITAHTEVVGAPDSNVTYSASSITLGPGFRIEAGATFHAGDYGIPSATVIRGPTQ